MCAAVQTPHRSARIMGRFITEQRKKSMKINLASTCLVIGTLLVPFSLHAADATATDTDRTHPKTFVKDSIITTKIKAKLAEEKVGSLARVKVDTHGHGAVVLRGKVRSQEEADRAIAIARGTEGVKTVTSHMRVQKDDS
jgi:hyperosmotically inducible periplasmic protein